jgi:nitric oxide reductase subunit B
MKRLWILLTGVMVISFAILGWIGTEIYYQAPPIPTEVVTTDGRTMISREEVQDGAERLAGNGRHAGRIDLGHGSYVAPDWTADYLHRESLFILDVMSHKEI